MGRFAKSFFILMACVMWGTMPARADRAAEVTAIIKSLAPIAGQSVSPGHTGAQLPDAYLPPVVIDRPPQIIIDRRPIILDYRYSLDLTVYFAYDSAFLTPAARQQLSLLGRALQSPELSGHRYLIAGHTDARGPDGYNVDLSYRRAWAVKRFLMRHFRISSWRLEVVGWGERYLRDPMRPYDGINRRVEVTLIDSGQPPLSQTESVPQVSSRIVPSLPPCPATVSGAITNPALDLDDFSPEPGLDCDPTLPRSGALIVQPDGRIIVRP